ncbi:MAG TPA: hypothetical protein VH372_26075 [Actinospica sp.]|nr:hypothetical protein [Actinospica sp.]
MSGRLGGERAGGGGRRRAGAPQFGAAELAAALQDSVSAIGVAGPPRAGLARVKRRAKARQRRRTVMAGSAGVLMLAVAVSVVTGDRFDIVPVLTGVVGLGGSNSGSGDGQGAQGDGGSPVRTVRPPADAAGKKGPAIGPLGAVAGVPTALAATGVPQCAAADLTTVTTVDAVIRGVSYGHVEAIAQHTCAVAGPPVLQVENAAGTAASSVVILRHEQSDGSQLADVPTWGTVLKLQVGQGYDFQFAWAPDGCAGAAAGAAGSAAGAGPSASSSGQASASAYTLSYLITGRTPTEPVDLTAACGATVYVTDLYSQGAYPLAKAPASPSAQPPSSSAPATSPSPTAAPPSSGPPAASSSAVAPSSSASASGGGGGSGGGSPAAGGVESASPGQPTNS